MRPVSATTTIDVPREQVYVLLTDMSLRPSFTDHFMTDYRLTRVEPVGVGAAARFRVREAPHWMDSVIDTAESPHLVREHGRGGRGNRVPTFTVWEIAEGPSPSSSEVTVTFWTEPATVLDHAREFTGSARRLRRDWKRAVKRLRDLAENGGDLQRVGVGGEDAIPALAR
jgi:uncharacterized protein YndB with AHSA1/START domain